jgi:hypothetical protein
MKKIIFLLAIAAGTIAAPAQNKPLNGSGKTVTKTFSFSQFDKISLEDLGGNVTVSIGKPFSIQVIIDDNLVQILTVKENGGKLTIALAGNEKNKLYLEKTNISINISMPEISVLQNDANCNVVVQNIVGRYVRAENYSNGDILLSGTIDELEVKKEGNGNINAAKLIAKMATAAVHGNGDVIVNVTETLEVSGAGNGNVTNTGKGSLKAGSDIKGNGDIITTAKQ